MEIPNATKPVDKNKCQTIIRNILHLQTRKANSVPAQFFIRELFQTQRCDEYFPEMATLRKDYQDYIGADSFERVMRYKVEVEDEARCARAVKHYRVWTENKLRAQLPMHLRFWEWSRSHVERVFAKSSEWIKARRMQLQSQQNGAPKDTGTRDTK